MTLILLPLALLRQFDLILRNWRRRARGILNPYRPERHYMRGPGPKWHARHSDYPNRRA